MKKAFSILSLTVFLLISSQVMGQDSESRSIYYISAHVATQGVGLEFKVAPKPAYGIRVGASILPISGQGVYSIRSEPTDVDFDVDFANAHLMLDWHPFLSETSLSRKVVVTAGAGYFWKAKGDVEVSYRGTYKYGDILIPSEDLGQLYGSVKWHKVAPYLGFGFENVLPAHKFNIGFAVGAYFMGAPDVTLTGTNYLSSNTSNEEQLRENMSYYRFFPVVQINLNFGL